MTIYAVIDTNVFVSAMLSRNNSAATVMLVDKMFKGEFVPVYSADTMKEYTEVLHRDKFHFNSHRLSILLEMILQYGLMLEPSPTGEILPDVKDIPFYEVVMEERKSEDAYLVTGNQKHFPVRPFIVTPKEMLDILDRR